MISSIRFGSIEIDGKKYDKDVIVQGDGTVRNWWRKEGSRLSLGDLDDLLKSNPKRVIIGNGMYRYLSVLPNIRAAIEAKGVKLDVLQSEKAVEEFNKSKDAQTIIAVHIFD